MSNLIVAEEIEVMMLHIGFSLIFSTLGSITAMIVISLLVICRS
jgi:hypothetical protein